METGRPQPRAATTGLPALPRLAGWAAIGLILALVGVQVRVTGRAPVNVAVTVAWIVTVTAAFWRLGRHETIWPWMVAASGVGLTALAVLHGLWLPAALSVGVAAGGLVLGFAQRADWVRLAANTGLLAIPAAADAVLLEFQDRPMAGTWMIPLVFFGVPFANLAWSAVAWARHAWAAPAIPADLPTLLMRQGYSPAGARRVVIAAGVVLGAAAVAMSVAHPFLANLGLFALVAAGVLAARPRAVQQVGGLPIAIYAWAALVLGLFVTSLRFGFLDPLFSQTLSGYLGWDYFLLPQAFDCLIHGISPYLPYPTAEQCSYGPWATPFVLHPLSAIFPGALLHTLPPWTSYGVFVAASLAGLFGLYILFAGLAERPLERSLIFLALFGNWTLYLMLWLGQTHIFTVLAFGLVLFWLLRPATGRTAPPEWVLVAGLLLSLFTKPLILLFVPALVIAPLTRRPALVATAIYALVSAVMVLAPSLNPGGLPMAALLNRSVPLGDFLENGNLYHWGNILNMSSGLHTNHRDIHVLSTLLNVVLPDGIVTGINRLLTLLTVGYAAWLAVRHRTEREAAQRLALMGCLMIALYYLAYSFAFEHQYPTLALLPAAFVVLLPRLADAQARRYVLLALIAFAPMLVPTIYRLVVAQPGRDILYDFSGETLRQMTLYKSFRVIPVLIMFTFTFLALRRLRSVESRI